MGRRTLQDFIPQLDQPGPSLVLAMSRLGIKKRILLLLVVASLSACQKQFFSDSQSQSSKDEVCFKEQCVKVEVVYKPEDLNRGLKFREKLDLGRGMLFVFPRSSVYSFWMKDTKIPLDMIWMDYSRRVVHVKKNVSPCLEDPCSVYSPKQEAMYVLELNSGQSEALGIQIGDTAVYKIEQPQ